MGHWGTEGFANNTSIFILGDGLKHSSTRMMIKGIYTEQGEDGALGGGGELDGDLGEEGNDVGGKREGGREGEGERGIERERVRERDNKI